MTEYELVYKVLSTSRGGRYKQSDSLSERLIRSSLLEARANLLLNFTRNGKKISGSSQQDFEVIMRHVGNNVFEGDLPQIMDLGKTRGLTMVHDYRQQLSLTHGSIQQQSLFTSISRYKKIDTVRYNNREYKISVKISDFDGLRNGQEANTYIFYCTGVLHNPEEVNNFGNNYNWETDTFPIPQTLELPLIEAVRKNYDEFVIGQKEE